MPSLVFTRFFKNPDNLVETNRTSERFFDGNSISRKVKATTYVGEELFVQSS
jgi:hypothetical protein